MWTLLLLAATVRSFVHMPLGISDRNKMVLWPGLGRREVRLHTSEEATVCSSLNCAARCILFTAPRACILCILASCRFANCAICSLVAGFALMVYGYRIIVLRCRWLITPVIRGKTTSLISRLCAGATGIAYSFRAACSPIARLPRVSLPWVTQPLFAYHPATIVDWTLPAQSRLRTQSAISRHKQ